MVSLNTAGHRFKADRNASSPCFYFILIIIKVHVQKQRFALHQGKVVLKWRE